MDLFRFLKQMLGEMPVNCDLSQPELVQERIWIESSTLSFSACKNQTCSHKIRNRSLNHEVIHKIYNLIVPCDNLGTFCHLLDGNNGILSISV